MKSIDINQHINAGACSRSGRILIVDIFKIAQGCIYEEIGWDVRFVESRWVTDKFNTCETCKVLFQVMCNAGNDVIKYKARCKELLKGLNDLQRLAGRAVVLVEVLVEVLRATRSQEESEETDKDE